MDRYEGCYIEVESPPARLESLSIDIRFIIIFRLFFLYIGIYIPFWDKFSWVRPLCSTLHRAASKQSTLSVFFYSISNQTFFQ